MKHQNPPVDGLAKWLAAQACPPPPSGLRGSILRRHRVRRARRPVLVAMLTLALGFGWLSFSPETVDSVAHWQSRSMALEADWRRVGDRDWLMQDARARALLVNLRSVDRDLAVALVLSPEDRESLSRLWQSRADLLARLIECSRQGGVALRI